MMRTRMMRTRIRRMKGNGELRRISGGLGRIEPSYYQCRSTPTPLRERPEVLTHINLRKDWKEQGLQVITKLANIELRPEEGKTSYEGGTWHIEGQLNEHIRASALYHHDQLNVTKSRLAFRQLTNGRMLEEMNYPQDDYEGIEQLFGFKHHRPCLQNLGSVVTKEGRLLVFPNVLQH
ncbi:hypothetical protein PM082_007458 [Marasmius tenuissimus]|nr:hypothetical protein PM082_007458 [Marasmius tenuissimus]